MLVFPAVVETLRPDDYKKMKDQQDVRAATTLLVISVTSELALHEEPSVTVY